MSDASKSELFYIVSIDREQNTVNHPRHSMSELFIDFRNPQIKEQTCYQTIPNLNYDNTLKHFFYNKIISIKYKIKKEKKNFESKIIYIKKKIESHFSFSKI